MSKKSDSGFWPTVFHVGWLLRKLTERNRKRAREKAIIAAMADQIRCLKRERSALQKRVERLRSELRRERSER